MKIRLIAPFVGVKGYRTLTLPCLAAEFEPFCDVEVNDQNVEEIDDSDVDLVGITVFIYNLPFAAKIAEKFRAKGVPVLFGGSAASVMPPELLLPYCDSVCVGEVEGLAQTILADVQRGALQKIYRSPSPPDLQNTRMPRVDLLSPEYPKSAYPVEASRGCPNHCSFCVSNRIQPGFRPRSLKDIERDIAHRDCETIELVDLNFGVNKPHILEVCKIIQSSGARSWFGETALNTLDDEELLDALEASGCVSVYVGLESISEASLASVNKGINRVADYGRVIKRIQERGLQINVGFVVGLDGEDQGIFRRTLEFFEKHRLSMCTPTFVTYLPGTDAFDQHQKQARILTQDWFQYSGVTPIIVPDRMSMDELLEGYEWFIRKFFSVRSMLIRSRQPALSLRFGWEAFRRQCTNYFMLNYAYRYWYSWLTRKNASGQSLLRDREMAFQEIQRPFQDHFKGMRRLTSILGRFQLRSN